MGIARVVLLGAAAVLAGAVPAAARAPSTADQDSLDWILIKLAEDRDHEKASAGAQDFISAYASGQGALSEWEPLVKIIMDPAPGAMKAVDREKCVSAILQRFKTEDERRTLDGSVVFREKKRVCYATLNLMLQADPGSRSAAFRLQDQLLPKERVQWKAQDSLLARRKAYYELKKWLEAK